MAARVDGWFRPSAIAPVLAAICVTTAAIAVLVLVGARGWSYYSTPRRVRAYHPAHSLLRPSGAIGEAAGVAGMAMMAVPVIYAVRKRWKRVARVGHMKAWLDVHIFCGTVGPVLVTFHTGLRFNGIVSVAYWSMVAVVLSGFVGRYLYARIPRTIRGAELSCEEIEERAAAMHADLAGAGIPVQALARLEAVPGGVRGALARRRMARTLATMGLPPRRAREVVLVAADRSLLLRRLAQLNRARKLFALWHAYHLPLVYVMFAIAVLHIGLAVYLGYAAFPRG